jgi:hypothetical protein
VAECGDTDHDLSVPDSVNMTYIQNDGERVCCSSGQYRSWTDTNQDTCNPCPVPGELFVFPIFIIYLSVRMNSSMCSTSGVVSMIADRVGAVGKTTGMLNGKCTISEPCSATQSVASYSI